MTALLYRWYPVASGMAKKRYGLTVEELAVQVSLLFDAFPDLGAGQGSWVPVVWCVQ